MEGGKLFSDKQIEVLAVRKARNQPKRDVSLQFIYELTGIPLEDISRILSNSTYGVVDAKLTATLTDDSFCLTQKNEDIDKFLDPTLSPKEKQNFAEEISNRNDREEKEKGGLDFNQSIPSRDLVSPSVENVKKVGLGFSLTDIGYGQMMAPIPTI